MRAAERNDSLGKRAGKEVKGHKGTRLRVRPTPGRRRPRVTLRKHVDRDHSENVLSDKQVRAIVELGVYRE